MIRDARWRCVHISSVSTQDSAAPLPMYLFFFFQAEDGIRDLIVTGVQTCALPICDQRALARREQVDALRPFPARRRVDLDLALERRVLIGEQIGRASCRERV